MTESTKIDYVSIVQDLRDEADLCRNETATDIADLLDDAASCIVAMKSQFVALRADLAAAQEALEREKKDRERLISANEHWHIRVKQERQLREQAETQLDEAQEARQRAEKERTEHLEWRTKLANDLDECERMRDVLARTVNVLDAENKELRSAETVAWMICEPECKYGPTFGTENAAWSALTKAPPGSELVELVKR